MPRRIPHGRIDGLRADAIHAAEAHPMALAGSAFVLGFVAGLIVKGGAGNRPRSLGRREPAPHEGQQRHGGTGALGVSPASVVTSRPVEHRS